jgi:hypothetical protein
MSEIYEYIKVSEGKHPDLKFSIYNISEPLLNDKYGVISFIKITYETSALEPLIMIPGYSNRSFMTMTDKLLGSFQSIKRKYSMVYLINWGNRIKDLSSEVINGITNIEEQYRINEIFRSELAVVVDKILRSKDMGLLSEKKNFALLGKSAGGGIALYIASMNHLVNKLFLCAPGTTTNGSVVKDRKDLDIKLSWNKDDTIIPFDENKKFITTFNKQKNKFSFFPYDMGGHELNGEFVKEL